MSPADDRQMLRDLVDAYTRNAHRRDLVQQAQVFTEDARVTFFDGEPGVHPPMREVQGSGLVEACQCLA